MNEELDEANLEELYRWIDGINLSRPKKDIRRDFSDGVLAAEVIKHYCPRLVELHNYQGTTSVKKKMENWKLMNWKVFRKLGFELGDDVINNICTCQPFTIEKTLSIIRRKIDRYLFEGMRQRPIKATNDKPEVDQQQEPDILEEQITHQLQHHQHSSPSHQRQEDQQLSSRTTTLNIKVPNDPSQRKEKQGKPAGGSGSEAIHLHPMVMPKNYKGEVVPKILVEEKEQEILSKDETIQILQAKVRRLEHLLYLKDIRVDDLTNQLNKLEHQMRPTQQIKPASKQPATRRR